MTTDERLDRIEKSIENLTGYVQGFRTETANRLEIIEKSIENLTRYVQDFRTETANRFEIMDSRLTALAAVYGSVEARMGPLAKAILDFGAIASRLQVEQSRIAKLVEPAA
jgi:hypothetical protein